MSTRFSTNLAIEDIDISKLAAYLTESGWKTIQHPNDNVIVFEGPEDDDGMPIDLVLPKEDDFQDSYLRLREAIDLISAIQGKSPHEVIQSIQDGPVSLSENLEVSTTKWWLAEVWREQREVLKTLTGHILAFMLLIGTLILFNLVFESLLKLPPQHQDILQRIDFYGIVISLLIFAFGFVYRLAVYARETTRRKTRATQQLKHQMERILSEEVKLSGKQMEVYVEQELYRISREAKQVQTVGSYADRF